MADNKTNPKVWLVGGLTVIAIGIGFVALDPFDNTDLGCALTAGGVGIIAEGLTRGRPTAQIVATATASGAANQACKRVVAAFRETPEESVSVTIETSSGAGEVSLTGSELTEAPPITTTCDDWALPASQQLCYSGQLGPPPIDFTPARPTCEDWNLPALVGFCLEGSIGPPAQE